MLSDKYCQVFNNFIEKILDTDDYWTAFNTYCVFNEVLDYLKNIDIIKSYGCYTTDGTWAGFIYNITENKDCYIININFFAIHDYKYYAPAIFRLVLLKSNIQILKNTASQLTLKMYK